MVSRIEPDRYADTGFSVSDTAPEVNAMLFNAMMRKSPGERLEMGMDMLATARKLVWASLPEGLPIEEQRQMFIDRFYGDEAPASFR